MTIFTNILNDKETKRKRTNTQRLADTYYDYHGEYDEEVYPMENIEIKGVVIA